METVTPMTSRRRLVWTASALLIACGLSIATVMLARRAAGADVDTLADLAVAAAIAQRPASAPANEANVQAMKPLMRRMISLFPVLVVVGTLVSTGFFSGVLTVAYRIAAVGTTWPMVFAACCTGAAAQALVRFVVTMIVIYVIKRPVSAESLIDNTFVTLDARAFLADDAGRVLVALASKIDLLAVTFVVGIVAYLEEEGFGAKTRSIIVATALCYGLWTVLSVGWAALWSMM